MSKKIEELENKVYELEFDLETKLEEIEEHSIDLNIIVQKMKEENERVSKVGDNESIEIANFNLYQIEKIEKLIKELKF